MKKATFLRIVVFAALLCVLLVVSVMADDAKIIRFDGTGNVGTNASAQATANGYFHIEGPVAYDIRNTLTVNEAERFTLYDYPYFKIKYRTNYPKSNQFYFDSKYHYYIDFSEINGANYNPAVTDGAWHTFEANYKTDAPTGMFTKQYIDSNGDIRIAWASSGNGAAGFPSQETPGTVDKMLFLSRSANANNTTFFMDVEYIAFFKTEEDMKAYDSALDAKIIRYDGYGNNTTNSKNTTAVVDDGYTVGKIALEPGDNNTYPTFADDAGRFKLSEYPYAAIRFKASFPVDGAGAYFYIPDTAPIGGVNKTVGHIQTTLDIGVEADNYYTTELYYPNDASTELETYTSTDGRTNSVELVNYEYYAGVNGITEDEMKLLKHFPGVIDEVNDIVKEFNINGFQFQFKGSALTTEHAMYLDYIAFFNSESDMKAYVSDYNAIIDAIHSINEEGYSIAMHTAVDAMYIENQLREAIIADIDEEFDAGVKITDYTMGDDTALAKIVLKKGDAVKATEITVAVDYAGEFDIKCLGAQIRADAGDGKGQGLRFGFTLDTANVPENCAIVEYGAVIGAGGSTPVLGDDAKYSVISSAKQGFRYYTKDGITSYNAVITNIPDGTGEIPDQRGTQLTVRPYVTYTFGGQSYTIYGESLTRSVNDVLGAAQDGWDK